MVKRYRLPLGLRDILGEQAEKKEEIRRILSDFFQKRNFILIETPLMEYEDVFESYTMDREKFYQVNGQGRENLVLRPDLTLPIARFLSTTNVELPQKFAYIGKEFQKQKELGGKYDEKTQAGVELLGYSSIKAEYEALSFVNLLDQTFFNGGLYVELAYATLADEVLKTVETDLNRLELVKKYLYEKNIPAYDEMIQAYKGQPIYPFLEKWPWLFGPIDEIEQVVSGLVDFEFKKTITKLTTMARKLKDGLGLDIRIDLSAMPPQKYYTGLIFTAYVEGNRDYIISGGRYDKLLISFQEQRVEAVGLGINLDEMAMVLSKPREKRTLLYSSEESIFAALKFADQHTGYEVSLADSLTEAKKSAVERDMDFQNFEEVRL